MKEMVYQKECKVEVLHEGEYNGYKFAILNLGTHPTAYVENKNGFKEYDQANKALDEFPHGGFTFLDRAYWSENDTAIYLGWDYAHYGDFMGYFPYTVILKKKWTTEEIYEEVKRIIDYLSSMQMTILHEEVCTRKEN